MALKNAYLIDLMNRVEQRNPNDAQFLITVRSVLESIEPVVEARPELIEKGVLELCVLSLLHRRDCYGYEISDFLSQHIEIADGTVYRIRSCAS